jgi:hypothetical protein
MWLLYVRAMTGFGYFGVLLILSARKPGAQDSRASCRWDKWFPRYKAQPRATLAPWGRLSVLR